jgi:hypothetical protein
MSYKDKFRQADTEAFNASIARDILERMDKLRLGANENMKRRWVWELMQNAKDVAQKNLPVEIKIDLSDNKLIFSHNGKCFTANDITFLIRQVSNKDREASEQEFDQKPTGKFGTGFLTTHLLSEQVEITGVAKEPDLDYRQFVLPLDRSGRTKDEIEQSVNKSVEVRDTLDEKPTYSNFNSRDFNTTFSYNLDEEGKKVAEIGINDLRISLPYTLAFSPMIKSVSIVNQNLVYEVIDREMIEDIEFCKIDIKNNGISHEINIVKLKTDNLAIAIEIEYDNKRILLKEFAEKLPRLFCDFPLIGTRTFNMPVIINSSDFNPTEPRDGVWLTDKDSEQIIAQNKQLFLEAFELYYKLLYYAVKNRWGNLYNLANTHTPKEKEWFSKTWIENTFQIQAREKLKYLPIVELENGELVPIKDNNGENNIYFPHHAKDEVRERIWDLDYKLFPDKLPAKRDIANWDKVIWSDCFKDTLKAITEFIVNIKTIEELSKRFDDNTEQAFNWLNEYYDLLNFEGKFIEDIINDKFSVIPNQLGVFKKRTELYLDWNIDEELKNVLCILDDDPKEYLRHKQIDTASKYKDKEEKEGQILHLTKNKDTIIEQINNILQTGNNANAGIAVSYLISLFSTDANFPKHREMLYNYCKLLKIELPEKKYLNSWNETIWENCDTPRIKRLVKIVSDQKNLSGLNTFLNIGSEEKTIEWLNDFIKFVKDRGLSDHLKNTPVLPNQKGDFCAKDDLSFDSGEIDETLKDILELLGYDIRKELIHNSIFLEFPKNAERKSEYVATEISRKITPRFSELPRNENTKEIFKKLYLWFNNNKEEAQRLFSDLYTNKHKLFDDEQLADMLKDKEDMTNEITQLKFENEQLKTRNRELEKLLEEKQQYEQNKKQLEEQLIEIRNNNPESTEIADIQYKIKLINNQINPIEDAIIAIENGYDNLSKNDQIKTNREAKLIVKERLEQEGFTFTQGIDGYSTIDGVKKDGIEYPLVVKSYTYQDAPLKIGANEWIQLMKPNSMFWVHFGNRRLACLKLADLLRKQDKLTVSFSTENLDVGNRLDNFAELLHYFSNVHFDFNSIRPDNYSTAANLNDYRFDQRSTETDLSSDNDDLL